MLLLVACRIGFDEVPIEGAISCNDGGCYCPAATSCSFACTSAIACTVDCTEAAFCAVDCGPSEYCVVDCPAGGCEVAACGVGCTVVCGGAMLASRNGANASCP